MVAFLLLVLFFSAFSWTRKFSIAHLADTHVGYKNSLNRLSKTVERINSDPEIELVFICGDITDHAYYMDMKDAKKELDKLNAEYYPVLGNHDIYDLVIDKIPSEPSGDSWFTKAFDIDHKPGVSHYTGHNSVDVPFSKRTFFQNYQVQYEDLLFLVLDFNDRTPSPIHSDIRSRSDGYVYTNETKGLTTLSWLKDRLYNVPSNITYVFLVLHHPILLGKDFWHSSRSHLMNMLENIPDSVKSKLYGDLSGHTHPEGGSTHTSYWLDWNPFMMYQEDVGNAHIDGLIPLTMPHTFSVLNYDSETRGVLTTSVVVSNPSFILWIILGVCLTLLFCVVVCCCWIVQFFCLLNCCCCCAIYFSSKSTSKKEFKEKDLV